MHKPSLGIAPEGFSSLLITGLATLTSAMLGFLIPTLILFILFLFCCNFFRDPERIAPPEASQGIIALSPADGRVVSIRKAPDPISGEPRQCVGIFMNVLNVHVNRMPVAGTIKQIRYFPGKFINASWDKASTDNERCAYVIEDKNKQSWTVVQIAGFLARRIVSHVDVDDKLVAGQRFGMIKFGSRVDVYFPENFQAAVGVGDPVWAGESVLAKKS